MTGLAAFLDDANAAQKMKKADLSKNGGRTSPPLFRATLVPARRVSLYALKHSCGIAKLKGWL